MILLWSQGWEVLLLRAISQNSDRIAPGDEKGDCIYNVVEVWHEQGKEYKQLTNC